jgi:hypothetical protein
MMLPSGGRHVTWLTLVDRTGTPLTDVGSAPLQLASGGG